MKTKISRQSLQQRTVGINFEAKDYSRKKQEKIIKQIHGNFLVEFKAISFLIFTVKCCRFIDLLFNPLKTHFLADLTIFNVIFS